MTLLTVRVLDQEGRPLGAQEDEPAQPADRRCLPLARFVPEVETAPADLNHVARAGFVLASTFMRSR